MQLALPVSCGSSVPGADMMIDLLRPLRAFGEDGMLAAFAMVSVDLYSERRPTAQQIAALGVAAPPVNTYRTTRWEPLGVTCTDEPVWSGHGLAYEYRTTLRFARQAQDAR